MNGETSNNVKHLMPFITTFVFDVDGVFTNGKVILNDNGQYSRAYHTRDGFAVRVALEQKLSIWIITGGRGASVHERFHDLGIQEVHSTTTEKKEIILKKLIRKYNTPKKQLCYMGDDLPDLAAMQVCAIKACPSDACKEILHEANYILPYRGGEGCVRVLIEETLRIQGKWNSHLNNAKNF